MDLLKKTNTTTNDYRSYTDKKTLEVTGSNIFSLALPNESNLSTGWVAYLITCGYITIPSPVLRMII